MLIFRKGGGAYDCINSGRLCALLSNEKYHPEKAIRYNKTKNIKGEKTTMKSMKALTQESFNDEVLATVKAYYGAEYKVSIKEVIKNNDNQLYGLFIRHPEATCAPTIYLDHHYNEYLCGKAMSAILYDIIMFHESNKTLGIDIKSSDITNFDNVKGKISFRLINLERNKEYLMDTPYIRFWDLAIVFFIAVATGEEGISSITIHNSLMNIWGADVNTVYSIAKVNTEILFPASIRDMSQVLSDMIGGDNIEDIGNIFNQMDARKAEPIMYIATNSIGVNGANVMLYDDLLRNFAFRKAANLYLIPSSIHEIIILEAGGHMKPQDIRSMIADINATEVSPEEVLSDNLYYYNRFTGSVTIAR